MGVESHSESPTRSPTRSGKRSRDPEDEVYVDNLHSHKRYLSEMMASSLNGLTVGDAAAMPMPMAMAMAMAITNSIIVDSPSPSPARDEMPSQYSPMSEDLDETPMTTASSPQSESRPTSPVRYKPPPTTFCSSPPSTSQPSNGCSLLSRQRGSDSEGRFPSSPSDICHSGDLRKAALLRSVQMRAQPSFDLGFTPGLVPMHNVESQSRSCSYMTPLDDEREPIHSCSLEPEFVHGMSCQSLDMCKGEGSVD